MPSYTEACQGCEGKVYPLEKITVHGYVFHKSCFKCKECSCILRWVILNSIYSIMADKAIEK